jgi:maltoporin
MTGYEVTVRGQPGWNELTKVLTEIGFEQLACT